VTGFLDHPITAEGGGRSANTRRRRPILIGAAVEGGLKIAALIDLARRPAQDVRGSKRLWALAIAVINSAGVVPIGYWVYGRGRA
jgi:hypothetical protein